MSPKKEPSKPEELKLPERARRRPEEPGPPVPVAPPYFREIENILQGQDHMSRTQFQTLRRQRIRAIEEQRECFLVTYYAITPLDNSDAKLLYNILSSLTAKPQKLDLMVVSPGGFTDPAYKMALMCREFCTEKFSVLVPHYAKSAATLLALGADEIVMGPSSELGPIDPQVRLKPGQGTRSIPALSLRDAISFIQRAVEEHPEQVTLFAAMLAGIDIRTLGEYERVIEGSEQYAKELLKRMFKGDEAKAAKVAERLVREYKIHGFVIDRRRAKDELKLNVIEPSAGVGESMWQLTELYDALVRQSRTAEGMICKVFETRELGPYSLRLPIKEREEIEGKTGLET